MQENQKKCNSSYINKTFCPHKEIVQWSVKEHSIVFPPKHTSLTIKHLLKAMQPTDIVEYLLFFIFTWKLSSRMNSELRRKKKLQDHV